MYFSKSQRFPDSISEEMQKMQSFHEPEIISGFRADCIRTWLRMKMALVVFRRYRNPMRSIMVLRKMVAQRRHFSGNKIRKMAKVGENYFWDLYIPGLKSTALPGFFIGEAERHDKTGKGSNRFNNLMIAITKICPYHCEHCFEWEALNQKEVLTLDDLKQIVERFQEMGTGQIQLTGGEPMLKIDWMLEILAAARPGTEFSIFTSGYNLTSENALKLKNAGLTTAFISLDHFDRASHDRFRGYHGSYDRVTEAVEGSKKAGLVTALSLCATRSFVNESSLAAYAELAKKLGVSFIQVLEPRSSGHYAGKDVTLSSDQIVMLENFYLKMNYDPEYKAYPIICYHGFYQRRIGCLGSADRSLYIDTEGNLHPCPFCRVPSGNALSGDLEKIIDEVRESGCPMFGHSKLLA
jgi:MoaA/NifB/PqqE/SkfB family radical SAM enzyme